MENIDKTINDLCSWIRIGLKETGAYQEVSILPEMVKALAELVFASAQNR